MNQTFQDQLESALEAAVDTENMSEECAGEVKRRFLEYRQPIIIEYFVRESYGRRLEYILDAGQRKIIQNLTRQQTIDSVIRELIRDLTAGQIIWKEVPKP